MLACPGLVGTEPGLVVHLVARLHPEARIDPRLAKVSGVLELPEQGEDSHPFTGQIVMFPKEADGGGLDLKTDIIGTGPF